MLKKTPFLGLVALLALLTTACVGAILGEDEDATDVVTEGDGTEAADDGPPGNPQGAVGAGDLADIELPAGVSPEQAEAMVATAVSGEVPPEVEDCVNSSLFTRPALFVAIVAAGDDAPLTSLSFDDQVAFSQLTIECASPELLGSFVADGFAEGADLAAPPEMGPCFGQRFAEDDGALMLVGMTAIEEQQPVDERSKGPLIDALTECVSGEVWATSVTGTLAADPTLAGAVDDSCIASAFDDPEVMRPFWAAFVENPDAEFEDLPPTVTTPVFGPLFDCVSIGAVFAAEAAANGITLSDESIACVDREASELGLFESFLAGEQPDDEALGLILFECLSADELSQFLGAA